MSIAIATNGRIQLDDEWLNLHYDGKRKVYRPSWGEHTYVAWQLPRFSYSLSARPDQLEADLRELIADIEAGKANLVARDATDPWEWLWHVRLHNDDGTMLDFLVDVLRHDQQWLDEQARQLAGQIGAFTLYIERESLTAYLSAYLQHTADLDGAVAQAADALATARAELAEATIEARRLAICSVAAGHTEAGTARALGVDRMTIRKWIGKR